jgi:hypothetical protein
VRPRKALRPAPGRESEPHRFDDQLYHRQINDRSRKVFKATSQARRRLAVSDGRSHVGTVEVARGRFVALDPYGRAVGTFASLQLAVRALPPDRGAP